MRENQAADSTSSYELILAATRRAILKKGYGKLTLSAVAMEAGVSRPTLYRWFPTRTHLFEALTAYERSKFDEGLIRAIEAHRSPSRKLDSALRYLVTYLDDSMGPDPIGVDPASALRSLTDFLPSQVESMVHALGASLDEVPTVRLGALSRGQIAEIFLRLAYSHYLIPHRNPEELLKTIRTLAGLSPRRTTKAGG